MAKKKSKKKHKKQAKKQHQKAVTQSSPKKTDKKPVAKRQTAKITPTAKRVTNVVTKKKEKAVLLIVLLVVIILGGIILFLVGQVQLAKDKAASSSQDELLKVRPADGGSLQPTSPGTTSNPQQAAPSPQGSTGDSSSLQQPVTPQETPTQ